MTSENKPKLEDLLTLSRLSSVNTGIKGYRQALRESNPEIMEQASTILSKVISNGDIPELLLNATPQALKHEVDKYKEQHSKEFDQAYQSSRQELLELYSQNINIIKERLTKKVMESEEAKKLSDELKQESIALSMYENLGQLLLSLELNPEYKEDNELVESYKKMKALDEAKPEELSGKTADALTGMYGLSRNARNLMHDWTPYSNQVRSIYGRMLAKKLLNDNLELNKDKFDKAFGTRDNYAQIAYEILSNAQKSGEKK